MAQEAIFQDSCFQPLIDHPSDDTIRDLPVKKVSKVGVRYRIEALFCDVDIYHPMLSLTSCRLYAGTVMPDEPSDRAGTRMSRDGSPARIPPPAP